MKVVIAPDSFKESLSAHQVAECIQSGFSEIFPDADYHTLPLADGGEGTVDVLLRGLNGEKRRSRVTGPLGEVVEAQWALLDQGKTALIEIAAASGLDRVAPERRNPNLTTSLGTGELIRQALDAGVDRILLGLGGSATNDGGAGIFQALGGRLLDRQGRSLEPGGLALGALHTIDRDRLHPRCREVEFIIACDVDNPLCGAHGASAVFGPQKGATAQDVAALDQALHHFADLSAPLLAQAPHNTPGFGAAGGAPLGLSLAFEVQLKPGIEMILDVLDADRLLTDADLVITGEGQMDNQTLQGKTPFGIARRARARGIPVIGIAGSLGTDLDELYGHFDALYGTVRSPQPLTQVLDEAQANLTRTARNIAATLKLGRQLKN